VLVERQISIACGLLSGALVAPEVLALTRDPARAAGGTMLVGVLLGTLGVLAGWLAALSSEQTPMRWVGYGLVLVLALGLTVSAGLAAVHAHGIGGRVLFTVSAVLPLGVPGWLWVRLPR
jgi:hypothetical protein